VFNEQEVCCIADSEKMREGIFVNAVKQLSTASQEIYMKPIFIK
jgi:hypothetical protein